MNAACMCCRYNDKTTDTMEKLEQFLTRLPLNCLDERPQKLIKFNYGNVDRCKYGISRCDKQDTATRKRRLLGDTLDNKLSSFIEHINEDEVYKQYHQLLNLLRGNGAYTQFEREVRSHRKET